jgi:phospholipid transport system transporter-binding protein
MLVLPASVTNSEARATLRLLTQAMRSNGAEGVVVDASPLQQLDSSAIAVLLECRRLAQASGRSFELRGAPPKLAALAQLYGVDALLLAAQPAAQPADRAA